MIRTSVLHQTHLLVSNQEDFTETSECNLRLREQECLSTLKKCKNMEEFKQSHAQILKLGFFWNSFCSSNLIATCALSEWGSMDYACSIFGQIEDPGSFEFNNMIRGHVKEMNLEDALHLFVVMLERGVEPDSFTYPSLLKACALLPAALEEGMQIHGQIFKLGFEDDLFVQNSLINLYGKCSKIELSRAVFDQIERRSVASWSALIAAHARLGMWSECLKLFGYMTSDQQCLRAEESILVSVLSACANLGALDLGRCTHGSLLKNLTGLNVVVETSLIDMYAKCGSLEKGMCVFRKMAEKNRFSYSVMISGLAMHGRGIEALRVFSEMLEEKWAAPPDDIVYVGVLNACSHAGLVEEGLEYFNKMRFEHKIEPTIQHYGCMVDLMGRAGMLDEAINLIKSMPMEPNDICWRSLLGACKLHNNLKIGETAARNLFQLSNSNNASDYVTLSNMYAQAQKWEKVAEIRKQMASITGLIQTKTPGFSLVEVKRKVYRFVSQDMSSPKCDGVYEMIHQMEWQLKFEGYKPDTSQVLLNVDNEEEKRRRLSAHSQKLAIAFALVHTSGESPVRIVRNFRMCSDCHTYTKLISMVFEREIVVRDRNRFHCFRNGTCSCKDYW